MTSEALRDCLLAVMPNTQITACDGEGRVFRVRSAEVSAGGTDPDAVLLHLEESHDAVPRDSREEGKAA